MNPCTCRNGCKFCRNSDHYAPPLKFKRGDRVKSKTAGSAGIITAVDPKVPSSPYYIEWADGSCGWASEGPIEANPETKDYRALIKAEAEQLRTEAKELIARADKLLGALEVLDEMDKKA